MQPNQPVQNPMPRPVGPPVAPPTAVQPAHPIMPQPAPPTRPVQPVMPQPISMVQAPSNQPIMPTAVPIATPPSTRPMPAGPPPRPMTAAPVRPAQPAPPAKPAKLTKEQQEQLNTTQNSLLISEIRENMVILNDGSFRAVIACESINYDLMSNEEREGIEYSYQNFLNTLYFPTQIVIQSRKIDIKPYLDRLEQIRAKQENMLLGVMMDDYLDFIFDIAEQANIMRKDFFVVVPYVIGGDANSDVNNLKNMTDSMISSVQKKQRIKIDAKNYDKAKDEIKNRVSTILNGLMNIGVRAGQLPTKALSELYYNFYNPDTAINEPISNLQNYTNTLYVKKAPGEPPERGTL